jgi:hypothetical protein
MMSARFAWESCQQDENAILTHLCPQCEDALTLHQPDEELADRLLATCENCKSWYLTDGHASVLTPIPEASDKSL